jgi:AcrR family transcriptional regulator
MSVIGMTGGAFYSHFPSKQALFQAVIEDEIRNSSGLLREQHVDEQLLVIAVDLGKSTCRGAFRTPTSEMFGSLAYFSRQLLFLHWPPISTSTLPFKLSSGAFHGHVI